MIQEIKDFSSLCPEAKREDTHCVPFLGAQNSKADISVQSVDRNILL